MSPDKKTEKKPEIKPSVLLNQPKHRQKKAAGAVADAKEQVEAVSRMGQRLRTAREINGWELAEAARHFGYANAGSLSKIELAKHVSAIPLWFIARAAEVYSVSTDYLHGLSDDLEMTPGLRVRPELNGWLQDELARMRQRDIECYLLLQEQVELALGVARDLALVVEEAGDALERFRASNKRYIDMRGSANLDHRMAKAVDVATTVAARMTKFKSMLGSNGLGKRIEKVSQLSLDLARDSACASN